MEYKKVSDISGIFGNCKSLKKIPDISKWDTHKLKDMSKIFDNCDSLISIPDINNWDISSIEKKDNIDIYISSMNSKFIIYSKKDGIYSSSSNNDKSYDIISQNNELDELYPDENENNYNVFYENF